MKELTNFLSKWQTLVGAVLGGVFALLVALLVAYKARRQQDLAAAMLLVGNLATIRTASRALKQLAEEEKIDKENLPYWLSVKIVRRRIKLSPLFEASRIRLMPVNVYLAVHLELFQVIFSNVEAKLDMLADDITEFDSSDITKRKPEILRAESKVIYEGFEAAVTHANCAERILVLKVLSNYPTFHTLRMLFKTKEEEDCQNLLRSKS
jgi:hypothetical protein